MNAESAGELLSDFVSDDMRDPGDGFSPAWIHDHAVWIAAAGWTLFAWFRMWQGTLSAPLVWQDSKVYESVASNALWSTAFWFGQRPPLAALLWKLTGSSEGFVIAQTVVSIASWTFLAWTVGSLVPRGWRRTTVYLVILAFSTVTPIMIWDRSVLSESLALSGIAVLFATTVRLARRPSLVRIVLVALTVLWIGMDRDSGIAIAVVLAFCFFAYAASGLAFRLNMRFAISMVASLSLVVVSMFCIVGALGSDRTTQNVNDVYWARVFPYPGHVAWFAAHGMPQSSLIDEMAEKEAAPTHGAAKVLYVSPTSPETSRLQAWLNKYGGDTYALWIAEHPWQFVSEPLSQPAHAFNYANGDLYFYAPSNRTTSGLTPALWPPWPWLFLFLGVAIGGAHLRKRWRDHSLWAIAVVGLIGIPDMLIAWNSDAEEVTRHTIEGLAELRLGILLALLVAVFGSTRIFTHRSHDVSASSNGGEGVDQAELLQDQPAHEGYSSRESDP